MTKFYQITVGQEELFYIYWCTFIYIYMVNIVNNQVVYLLFVISGGTGV
jgi:hypothetical protein